MCQRATVHPRAKNPAIGVLASDEVPSTTHGVQNQPANTWQTAKQNESMSITDIKNTCMGMPYLKGPMKCLFVPCQQPLYTHKKNMASRLRPVRAINRSPRITSKRALWFQFTLQIFIHVLSIARSTFAAIWSPCQVSVVYPKSAQKICWGAESAQTTWRYWTWPLPRRTSAVLAGHLMPELW